MLYSYEEEKKMPLGRNFSKESVSRAVMCAIGVAIMGIGVGLLRYSNFGIDPFMSLTNGLYLTVFSRLGISFGTSFLVFCLAVLSVSLIFDRSKIGLGTVINMIIPGYVSDLLLFLLQSIPVPDGGFFVLRIAGLLGGITVICFGTGIYLNTNIGTSPYDATALIITEKLNKPRWYRFFRIGTDIICTVLGFLMGSIPGVATLVMACMSGPLMSFFRSRVLIWGKKSGVITWV
jgi:uncharacterized membrane protein YczE